MAHRDRGQGAEFTSAFGGAADVRLWTALAGHDANDPLRHRRTPHKVVLEATRARPGVL